jgi:hypothetical protein
VEACCSEAEAASVTHSPRASVADRRPQGGVPRKRYAPPASVVVSMQVVTPGAVGNA